eukprot:GHVS01104612.1.p1 GENE.GHVS01104612.1~~GHVS01104612.1.p1  ORF type:complete len:442 (-),score=96.33 GHVS01104612.1:13-1338(-)
MLRAMHLRLKIDVPRSAGALAALPHRSELEWLQNRLETTNQIPTEYTVYGDRKNVADTFSFTPFTAQPSNGHTHPSVYSPFYPYRRDVPQPPVEWADPVGQAPCTYSTYQPEKFEDFAFDVSDSKWTHSFTDPFPGQARGPLTVKMKRKSSGEGGDGATLRELQLGQQERRRTLREKYEDIKLVKAQREAQRAIDARYLLLRRGLWWHGALQMQKRFIRGYWRYRNMPRDPATVYPYLLPPPVVDAKLKEFVNTNFRKAVLETEDLKTACLYMRKYTNLIEFHGQPRLLHCFNQLFNRAAASGKFTPPQLKQLQANFNNTRYRNKVQIKLLETETGKTEEDLLTIYNQLKQQDMREKERKNLKRLHQIGFDLQDVLNADFSGAVGSDGRGNNLLAEMNRRKAKKRASLYQRALEIEEDGGSQKVGEMGGEEEEAAPQPPPT